MTVLLILFLLLTPAGLISQTMSIEEYTPISTLVVPEHTITRAKFPFVDVHNHQWRMDIQNLDSLVAGMDSLNMAVMVNLSGRGLSLIYNPDSLGEKEETELLKKSLQRVQARYANRFIIFTNIRFDNIDDPAWAEKTVAQLRQDVRWGAKGLKIYKELGLNLKDKTGRRIPVDDPRIDPIWEACGELGIPVLIHSGEPAVFWKPKDKYNERWLELKQKPNRYRDPKVYPPWRQVMQEHLNVFKKHPNTTFISAHMGWRANDLTTLGRWLDEHPNMYTEIGAVLAELGRQPRFARKWFIKYQDRVLFGKDTWHPKEYYVYFRVLETADEYFDYYRKRHAFWKMYGMNLPDDVLRKLYYKNALKIFPHLDRSLFPAE